MSGTGGTDLSILLLQKPTDKINKHQAVEILLEAQLLVSTSPLSAIVEIHGDKPPTPGVPCSPSQRPGLPSTRQCSLRHRVHISTHMMRATFSSTAYTTMGKRPDCIKKTCCCEDVPSETRKLLSASSSMQVGMAVAHAVCDTAGLPLVLCVLERCSLFFFFFSFLIIIAHSHCKNLENPENRKKQNF